MKRGWGINEVPVSERIDLTKRYLSNGKQVTDLKCILNNSVGNEVSYPIKGSVMISKKPLKFEYMIWSLRGETVIGEKNKWDLIEAL